MAQNSLTCQDVINTILAAVPGAPLAETVDTFKAGNPTQPVTGIVTTFLATYAVLERAAALGANLVITHEPIYYNHLDETGWLENDPVYAAKRCLIAKQGLVIWRFHDHWHLHRPDGILTGFLQTLGWESYADPTQPEICTLPPTTLGELAGFLKQQIPTPLIRMVGNPGQPCQRVGLILGAYGGRGQIQLLNQAGLDVLVCGEINEWETNEYTRDALAAGMLKGLLVVGHAASEEPGMRYLVEWLNQRLTGVSITHVPCGDAFRYA
jgi:putative NIF3 family GTP cyclohydrolase 1 type 2